MKVKIYINNCNYLISEQYPRVLTEKQYQEKIQELVKSRMENLVEDDGFEEHLAEYYHIHEVFFLSEEEKAKMIESFKPYALDGAKETLADYYDEYEIEI